MEDGRGIRTTLLAASGLAAMALTELWRWEPRHDWAVVDPVILGAVLAGVALGWSFRRFGRPAVSPIAGRGPGSSGDS